MSYFADRPLASKLAEDTAGPDEILLTAAAARECLKQDDSLLLVPAGFLTIGEARYEYFRHAGES